MNELMFAIGYAMAGAGGMMLASAVRELWRGRVKSPEEDEGIFDNPVACTAVQIQSTPFAVLNIYDAGDDYVIELRKCNDHTRDTFVRRVVTNATAEKLAAKMTEMWVVMRTGVGQ